jgi:RecB family endonuclease NucS
MIKPDGNFLVIGSTKHKPRNWQPTGAETTVRITNETLVLESHRSSPKEETLTVNCDSLYELVAYDAGRDPDVVLEGTEEDMHERIMNHPSLVEEGFEATRHEKPVDSGRSIDVFGYDDDGVPVVVEVKRRRGQRKDVDQLNDYTSQFRADGDARGILVAPSVSDSVLRALADRELEFVRLQPRKPDGG